jgi:hypothetical protein
VSGGEEQVEAVLELVDAAEVEQRGGPGTDGGVALCAVAVEFAAEGPPLGDLALDEQAGEGKIFVAVAIAGACGTTYRPRLGSCRRFPWAIRRRERYRLRGGIWSL